MSPKKLKEYEQRGVGLLASGAYVLSSFRPAELEKVAAQNWNTVLWDDEPRLIVIRSETRGAQARFGQVSRDGQWLAYPTFPRSYGSVDLFRAEIDRIPAFLRRMLEEDAKVWDVRKPAARSTKRFGRGFLMSANPDSRHNALLCCDDEGIHLIPFGLDPPPHAPTEVAQVTAVHEADRGAAVRAFESALRRSDGFESRYKNTSLFYRQIK